MSHYPRTVKKGCETIKETYDFDRLPKKGHGFIYIYSFKNGRSYIGQTIQSINKRLAGHRHGSLPVDEIIKQGVDFTVDILSEPKAEFLNQAEIYCISKFGTLVPNGYNIQKGGQDAKESGVNTSVICLETKKVYQSLAEASADYGKGRQSGGIRCAIKYEKQHTFANRHWMDYSDFNLEHADDILQSMISFEEDLRRINMRQHAKRMSKMGGKYSRKTKVVCLENGLICDSYRDMAHAMNIPKNIVCSCAINGSSGMTGYHFIRYEEWMEGQLNDVLAVLLDWEQTSKNLAKNIRARKCFKKERMRIICLETGKIYDSCNDAISCEGLSSSALKDSIYKGSTANGKHWVKYQNGYEGICGEFIECLEDWQRTLRSVSSRTMRRNLKKNERTVIKCLETGDTFASIRVASEHTGIAHGNIARNLRGELKHTHGYHFVRVTV